MLLFEKYIKKIKREWTAAFCGVFIGGILTYIYTICNHFMDEDSVFSQFVDQNMISSGRHILTYAGKISSYYDLNALNVLLGLFYLGLAAAIIAEEFKVKSRLVAVLLGAVLVTFPSIASTLTFTFTFDAYMLAVLMATVAWKLAGMKGWRIVPAVVLVGLSLGIYQAYYSFLIILCILSLLYDLIDIKEIKNLWKKTAGYLIMGIGGYAFYVFTLKLALKLQDRSLSVYQGAENITAVWKADILTGLYHAYWNVKRFLLDSEIVTVRTSMTVAVCIIICSTVVLYFWLFRKNREHMAIRIICVLVLVLAVPLGIYSFVIVNPWVYVYNLMEYAWALLFIFGLILADRLVSLRTDSERAINYLTAPVIIAAAVLVFEFAVADNILAFNMNERYEKTYAMCLRVIDRLENTEDFSYSDRVAVIGAFLAGDNYPSTNVTGQTIPYYVGGTEDYCLSCPNDFYDFTARYLGVYLNGVYTWDCDEIIESPEFARMPSYPDAGAVRKIGDTWVVKLN